MSARYPDFTDRFHARTMLWIVVLEGQERSNAGDLKTARAKYREAQKWEREVQRVEAAIQRQRARYTSARGRERR